MLEDHTAHHGSELALCLSQLEYCSTKVDGVLSAVNAYVKRVGAAPETAGDLVALCDILKQYLSEFWETYNQALQLLNRPSDGAIQAALDWIERESRIPDL